MACSAAVLALAMAACSSSSDDNPPVASNVPEVVEPEVVEPEVVEPEPTSAEQLAAANAAFMAAQGLVDALTSTSTAEEAAAAYTALGAAQAALHAATNLPANQIAALQAQIDQLVLDLDAANLAPTVALEQAQEGATTAATEAMEAATAAMVASDAAQTARENRATLQTGDLHAGNSGELAHAAYMQAKAAADAATEAQTASEAAAEATDPTVATRQLIMAETARDNAETAQGMAETQSAAAVAATMTELMIDGKTKSVGDTTSITITGVGSSETVGDKTANTGLIAGMKVTTPGARTVNGLPLMHGTPMMEVEGRMAAAADIGVTYDSSDDSARLTLVTSYLGTQKQKQFLRDDDNTVADLFNGTFGAPNVATPSGGQDLPPNAVSTDEITDGAVTIPANTAGNLETVIAVPKVAGSDFRDVDAPKMSTTLYYVLSGNADMTTGDTDDGIDQTKIFLERDTVGGMVTYSVVNVVEVTVDAASAFEHIHYGLWNGLSGSGANTVADLGIGFVTATPDGMGMTEEMPNHGTATYNGNYVANVQEADLQGDGTITRMADTASMVADFMEDDVDITLTGLVTLDGDIDGNTFSGTTAALIDTNAGVDGVQTTSGLATDAKFDGSFSGGFFGTLAAEAGGVFDFSTKDNKGGAFRGAFGGKK